MKYTTYTNAQVKACILLRLKELEEKMETVHPNSFTAKTYPIRKARYLELLEKVEKKEQLSAFIMSKLFHKGARHVTD